jgi:hypothetical protein
MVVVVPVLNYSCSILKATGLPNLFILELHTFVYTVLESFILTRTKWICAYIKKWCVRSLTEGSSLNFSTTICNTKQLFFSTGIPRCSSYSRTKAIYTLNIHPFIYSFFKICCPAAVLQQVIARSQTWHIIEKITTWHEVSTITTNFVHNAMQFKLTAAPPHIAESVNEMNLELLVITLAWLC